MGPHRVTLATGKTDDTGEAEYLSTDVREYEETFGTEILDYRHELVTQFLYTERTKAEVARVAMFKVLADVVEVATASDE